MAEALLKFDLIEEREDFDNAIKGSSYRSALFDIDQWLRSKLKYEELTEAQHEAYETTRKQLWDILNSNGVEELC